MKRLKLAAAIVILGGLVTAPEASATTTAASSCPYVYVGECNEFDRLLGAYDQQCQTWCSPTYYAGACYGEYAVCYYIQ